MHFVVCFLLAMSWLLSIPDTAKVRSPTSIMVIASLHTLPEQTNNEFLRRRTDKRPPRRVKESKMRKLAALILAGTIFSAQ